MPFIQCVTPERDVSGQAKRKAQITIRLRGAAMHLAGTRSRWHQAYRRPPCLWSCSKKPTGASYGIKNAIVFYIRQLNCTLLAGRLHHNLTTKNHQVIPIWLTWRYPHAQTKIQEFNSVTALQPWGGYFSKCRRDDCTQESVVIPISIIQGNLC